MFAMQHVKKQITNITMYLQANPQSMVRWMASRLLLNKTMANVSKFLLIFQMVPTIIAMVQQIEHAIPQKGMGPQKLDLVLNTISAVANTFPEMAQNINQIQQAVTPVVNTTVKTFKDTGIFQ